MTVVVVRERAKSIGEPVDRLPNRTYGSDAVVSLALLKNEIDERDANRRARYKESETYVGLPALPKPERWQLHAACREMDPAIFFTVGRPNVQAVKACLSCTVREPCLERALEEDADNKDSFGYRGGMRPGERKKHRKYANSKLAKTRAKNAEIREKFTALHVPTTSRRDLIITRLADHYGMSQGSVKRLVNDLA